MGLGTILGTGIKSFGAGLGGSLIWLIRGGIARFMFVIMVISMILLFSGAIKESWQEKDGMIFVNEIGGRIITSDSAIKEEVENCLDTCEDSYIAKWNSLKDIFKSLWGLMVIVVAIFLIFHVGNTSQVLRSVLLTIVIVGMLQIIVIGVKTGSFHIPYSGIVYFGGNLGYYFGFMQPLIDWRTGMLSPNNSNLTS